MYSFGLIINMVCAYDCDVCTSSMVLTLDALPQ
jgi:hypothetical protein